MPTGRYNMGCGVARNANGSSSVVVVGGFSDPESAPGTYLDTVEIYSVEGRFWTMGKSLRTNVSSLIFFMTKLNRAGLGC